MDIRDESALLLTDLTEIAWRRKWWLLVGASVGLLAGFLLLQRTSPLYTAGNTVLVETQEIPEEYVNTAIAQSDLTDDLMDTIEERITSEPVLRSAAKNLAPRLDPADTADLRTLMGTLEGGLAVRRSPDQWTVFEISYTSPDPEVAADVVTEVTETFIEDEFAHRTRQSATTATFLADEAERLREELVQKEAEIRRIKVRETALPDHLEEKSKALSEVRAALARARIAYTEEHPNVQRLAREVRDLERELVGESYELGGLTPAETNLLRDYDKLVARYHEIDNRRLEAGLSKKVDEARQYERFRVLRPAYPPQEPSWPDPRFFYAGGLAGGLALGVLLAAFAEYRRPTFRTVDRLTRTLDVPIVTAIPNMAANDKRIFHWTLWQRLTRAWRRTPVDPLIVTHTAPRSAPAEQYRQFLPAITKRQDCRVVVVTSAAPGDGKSLSCLNLAAAVARDLERWVLVVDADLRRPNVERMLRVDPGPGLSELVENGGSFSEHDIVESPIPNLSVLGTGTRVRDPLQTLGSESFKKLIEQARRDFDYVFLDSPPLLPVVDTRLLRDVADAVVFVVRSDRTPRDAVLRSLHELEDVAGVVFNDVQAASYKRYYYYDAYDYYDDSGRKRDKKRKRSRRSGDDTTA